MEGGRESLLRRRLLKKGLRTTRSDGGVSTEVVEGGKLPTDYDSSTCQMDGTILRFGTYMICAGVDTKSMEGQRDHRLTGQECAAQRGHARMTVRWSFDTSSFTNDLPISSRSNCYTDYTDYTPLRSLTLPSLT